MGPYEEQGGRKREKEDERKRGKRQMREDERKRGKDK